MIIIGDVHGEYDLLMKLVDKLPHDNIWFVGDLIDRGFFSKDVVEFVKNNNYTCVLGNHEDFMIKSYNDDQISIENVHDIWDYNGGRNTVGSYFDNQCFNNDLFFEHREWFKTLPIIYWVDEVNVVSHSRYLPFLNEDIKDSDVINNILWSRLHTLHPETSILNIHGHSIIEEVKENNNYLNIDTGAFYHGVLTAYDTETKIIYQAESEIL